VRKGIRRLLWVAGTLAGVGLVAWYPLVRHSPRPTTAFELDLAKVRALADSLPGSKPTAIRYERIMEMEFFEAMVMAGEPWTATPMPVYSYQLSYPDQTLIIDTALARETMQPQGIVTSFDEAAFQRMNAALLAASQIVVTHEHADHIGGALTHPQLARLKPALRLTPQQLGNSRGMAPLKLPPELEGYRPFDYQGMAALAPGVVLIRASGHTPGSQMVFVKRADGRELLFLGDVSWRTRNIEQVRERPLFMTLLIGEDRQAVLAQFAALNDLSRREPKLAQVPGHDAVAIQRLTAAGFMDPGFL
jgi:glyoxylase-like metal-dependent hydrolase (beta-lactamase superfamily II)